MTKTVVTDCLFIQYGIPGQVAVIVDIGKRIDVIPMTDHVQQILKRKNPVGIEFYPLIANGNGKVEFATLFQHAIEVLPSGQMPVIIHTIPISSKAKVLKRMKA